MYRALMMFLVLTFSPALVAAQQPCTTDARQVVGELYRHMLERGADPGSSNWVQQLQNGQTVREVVRQIAKSDEHIQRFWRPVSGEQAPYIRAVGTMYRHLVARAPDQGTARSWATSASRANAATIIDFIIDSDEYDQLFGDWGVPGSGGISYCGRTNQGASQASSQRFGVNQGRFDALDRNNDGVITRNEWRGTQQAFEVQDWDNDGVLSGDEVDAGAARFETNERNVRRTQRFENLDVNANGRIEPREWDGTVAAFNRLDVNNDNILSRSEMVEVAPVGTAGEMIRVNGQNRWTDTFLNVRAGDVLTFDSEGTVRLSTGGNDFAGVSGATSARRAVDAPLPNQPAGALIARIGNSAPLFIGNRRTLRAPATGRLYLGVNDDHLEDNSGDFQVVVSVGQ